MTAEVAELLEKAMQLPQEAREELAEAILGQSERDEDYIAELVALAERRMENVRTGKSHLIPADEVFREIYAELDRANV